MHAIATWVAIGIYVLLPLIDRVALLWTAHRCAEREFEFDGETRRLSSTFRIKVRPQGSNGEPKAGRSIPTFDSRGNAQPATRHGASDVNP
jgi:hypothetical protein